MQRTREMWHSDIAGRVALLDPEDHFAGSALSRLGGSAVGIGFSFLTRLGVAETGTCFITTGNRAWLGGPIAAGIAMSARGVWRAVSGNDRARQESIEALAYE